MSSTSRPCRSAVAMAFSSRARSWRVFCARSWSLQKSGAATSSSIRFSSAVLLSTSKKPPQLSDPWFQLLEFCAQILHGNRVKHWLVLLQIVGKYKIRQSASIPQTGLNQPQPGGFASRRSGHFGIHRCGDPSPGQPSSAYSPKTSRRASAISPSVA